MNKVAEDEISYSCKRLASAEIFVRGLERAACFESESSRFAPDFDPDIEAGAVVKKACKDR